MDRPGILVLPLPNGAGAQLAALLRAAGRYDVVAPDLNGESWDLDAPFAAVITSRHLTGRPGVVIIEVPATFEEPVGVTVDGVSVSLKVELEHPLESIASMLDELLTERRQLLERSGT